jgi:hypothetical protein
MYEVTVLADGYLWQGERHASLSAIARAITGARRNGDQVVVSAGVQPGDAVVYGVAGGQYENGRRATGPPRVMQHG